jgi:integrase
VLKCIEPHWARIPQTIDRVRGRVEAVIDWATTRGYRTGDNPARWKGHLDNVLPSRAAVAKSKHFAALAYREVPAFVATLRQHEGIAPRALEFLILTAARSGETLGARWDEIDLDARMWVVPPERMKMRRQHRVPLSDRAVEILTALPRDGEFVFFGSRASRLPHTALDALLERLGYRGRTTVHGLRSSFRDWCSERTNVASPIIEMSLAHVVGSATERAYARSDLIDQRRRLMENWARFVSTEPTEAAEVVPIRGHGQDR